MALRRAKLSEVVSTPAEWRIETWFPDLGAPVFQKLRAYSEELNKFNRTLNLVSPKTLPMADVIHFADSILASKALVKAHPQIETLYDFGSGNGFPGLVIAALNPSMKLVLVDSDQRKCEFIKHTASLMALPNVQVLNSTIEALPPASVKYGICRGFANISKTILLTRKLVPAGGAVFHMKGENWPTEVREIPTQLCSVWTPALVADYKLPIGSVKFALVRTDKIS